MRIKLYKEFEKLQDKGPIWLIGDPHFGNDRGDWPASEERLRLINSKVGKHDSIVILGDVGDLSYAKRLKGDYKVLITGNHDSGVAVYEPVFDMVFNGPVFINGKILLSHEPVKLDFGVNIHGHQHFGTFQTGDGETWARFNLTSDVIGFVPMRLDHILSQCKSKTIHENTVAKAKERKCSL